MNADEIAKALTDNEASMLNSALDIGRGLLRRKPGEHFYIGGNGEHLDVSGTIEWQSVADMEGGLNALLAQYAQHVALVRMDRALDARESGA